MSTLPLNVPQFFFDDAWIDFQQRLTRRWMPAKIYPEPVLKPEQPWEKRCLTLFGTVTADPDKQGGYRLYHASWAPLEGHFGLLVATSDDGVRWTRPELDIIPWEGRKTNAVMRPVYRQDSPSIIYEPGEEFPFKLIGFEHKTGDPAWGKTWGLAIYRSRDGLHWETFPDAVGVRLKAGDRTNVMPTRVNGKYVIYTRAPDMMQVHGRRTIYRSESDNFRDWSPPELVLTPDLADGPHVEFYGMSAFVRHGWHIGLLEYWHAETDTLETHFAVSRDGKTWLRPHTREPFIAPTYPWNRKWNTCASNGPIIVGDVMVFYFGSRWTSHHYDAAQLDGTIGYASIPIDRFCALEAATWGSLTTPAFAWPGGELALNFDARESYESHPGAGGGEIVVEVCDPAGKPLDGWGRATIAGNTHCRMRIFPGLVEWPEGKKLASLVGQTIRLRFHMKHARLFTFEARA